MYYNPYNNTMTTQEFQNAMMGEDGQLDPSGLEQDCLGMTPFHILACSTVQCLELYQLMIEYYPGNLIVEDAWGAVPFLYAVWGEAPSEIIHFLVESYQIHYPDHEFDWNAMVIMLGKAGAQTSVIQNLLDIQQTLSPGYNIDWDPILGVLAERSENHEFHLSPKLFCFLTRCSIATRVSAIGIKHFRDSMSDDDWMGDNNEFNVIFNRQEWRTETFTKLEYYESEYLRLKESTSLLELALWKIKINDSSLDHGKAIGGDSKKMKIDPSELRLQCRISCGDDHVVENVLPYLLPPDFVRSYIA
jgi:hypothetical protein